MGRGCKKANTYFIDKWKDVHIMLKLNLFNVEYHPSLKCSFGKTL
jgi:hypothetical protein